MHMTNVDNQTSFPNNSHQPVLAGPSFKLSQPGRLSCAFWMFLIVCLSIQTGCGSGETVIDVTPAPALVQLRTTLEEIAEAGVVDSSVAYAQQLAEEIAAEDPGKSQLIAETEKLTRVRGKSAIQKQVAEILKLLE